MISGEKLSIINTTKKTPGKSNGKTLKKFLCLFFKELHHMKKAEHESKCLLYRHIDSSGFMELIFFLEMIQFLYKLVKLVSINTCMVDTC